MRRLAIPVRLAVAAAEVAVARHERSDLQDSRTAHKVTVLRKMDLKLLALTTARVWSEDAREGAISSATV